MGVFQIDSRERHIHVGMLAQIVVHTNPHPYHIQIISFWISLLPVLIVIGLIILVQYWRVRRNRGKD